MAGRRVVLLTKGYLHGWLDFIPKTQLSARRENFILNAIEEEEFSKIRHLRAVTDAIIGAGVKSKEMLTASFESFQDYLELTLPYLAKNTKIDEKKMNELTDVKAYLKKKKLELNSKATRAGNK